MTVISMAFLLGALGVTICLVDATIYQRRGMLTLYRFFLEDGKLELPGFVSTIVAANLSLGNFIVFICTWGYNFGFAGIFFFVINLAMNVIGFLVFLKRFKPYIEDRFNNGTIHDYLSQTYGGEVHPRKAGVIRTGASVVTVTGLVFAMVFELSLAVQLLHPKDMLESLYYFGCLAALIALFTAYGGFRTLIASDIVNATILTTGLVLLLIFLIRYSVAAGTAPVVVSLTIKDIRNIGWPSIVSIMLIGSGWMLVAMDQWQRTCASRSYKITFNGMLAYFGLLALFAITFGTWGAFDHRLMPTILGPAAAAQLQGSTNPLLDISRFPINLTYGQYALTFIVSGLVFAGVSTTNTFLNVCSHSLTTDVLVSSLVHKEIGELTLEQNRLYVGLGRGIIILIASTLLVVFAVLSAFRLMRDPLSFFYIAYSIQFALLAPMVFSAVPLKYRPGSTSALLSLGVGFAFALGVGFGAWFLAQGSNPVIVWVKASDWQTLTPVATFVAGSIPLVFGLRRG